MLTGFDDFFVILLIFTLDLIWSYTSQIIRFFVLRQTSQDTNLDLFFSSTLKLMGSSLVLKLSHKHVLCLIVCTQMYKTYSLTSDTNDKVWGSYTRHNIDSGLPLPSMRGGRQTQRQCLFARLGSWVQRPHRLATIPRLCRGIRIGEEICYVGSQPSLSIGEGHT